LEFHRTIPNGPRAPAEARAMVSDLGADVPREVLDRVRLVASEIVTNSYKHAGNPVGAPIRVALSLRGDRLRLEVVDHSLFDPTPETDREQDEVRWGLRIVKQVTNDWGRISEGGIWAEFDVTIKGDDAGSAPGPDPE